MNAAALPPRGPSGETRAMNGDMHEHTQAPQATAQQTTAQQETPRAFFRPKPDGNTDPAGEAGWYLERERERRGLSLQTASRATGVHPQHLRAIELGMLENLPARDDALRMIAAYARFLGFDPQPLVAHFETCLPPEKQEKAFSSAHIISFPLVQRLRDIARTPAGMGAAVLTAVMLFGGLGWALWPTHTTATPPAPRTVAETDTNTAQAANQAQETIAAANEQDTTPSAAGKPADPIAALIARTVPQVEDADTSEAAQAAQTTAQRTPPAPVTPPLETVDETVRKATDMPLPPPPAATTRQQQASTQPDTPLTPQAARPLQEVPSTGIALRAAEQIWLRLEDDDGLPWFVGFLKAGQVLALPSDRTLRLSASDVHRLEWYVNGQRMGRVGKRGADFLSEPLDGLYKQSGLKLPRGRSGSAG